MSALTKIRSLVQLEALLACEPAPDFPDDLPMDPPLTYGELRAIVADVQDREARLAAAVDTQMARAAGLAGRLGQIAAIARPAG